MVFLSIGVIVLVNFSFRAIIIQQFLLFLQVARSVAAFLSIGKDKPRKAEHQIY